MKNDLRWEPVGEDAYDYVLFFSFILLVPVAFVLAVGAKLRHVQRVLSTKRNVDSTIERRQMAFDLQIIGLAEHSHRRALKRYIEGWFVLKKYAVFLSHFKVRCHPNCCLNPSMCNRARVVVVLSAKFAAA